MNVILIIIGTVCVGLGAVGIVVPGLPATPFFLAAAACYVRSSDRLYSWLLGHRTFGVFVRSYIRDGGMTVKARVISLTAMWIMIIVSIVFFLQTITAQVLVAIAGVIGTVVIALMPSAKNRENKC